MNVLYDISALGFGHHFHKTGIFRVAENVAYGLFDSKECDLSFCASSSFRLLNFSTAYLDDNCDFASVPFLSSPVAQNLAVRLCRAVETPDKWPQMSASSRLLQRLLWRALFVVEDRFSCLSAENLAGQDIFHTPLGPLPPADQKFKKTQRFLTVHDLIRVFYPQYFQKDALFEKLLDNLSPRDWTICVSQSTKNDLCNYRPDLNPERAFVIPLAASEKFHRCSESEVVAIKQKYGIPPEPYVLSLCTLEPRKNIDHAIRSFLTLVREQKIAELNLVLVGARGWDSEKIFAETLADEALRKRVIITGYVTDEDIAAIYSGALMFVYPSLYEGFGLPPLEAMQCGVPVITSNTSSLPEVVGDAGIMVAPKDPDALCNAMLRLINSSSLQAQLTQRSLERAAQFTWQRCIDQTLAAYRTALSS